MFDHYCYQTLIPYYYEPDNDRADMHAIHRPTDRAYTPAIYRLTDRRALRSTTITTQHSHRTATYHRQTDSAAVPTITINNRACTATINRPINRQALYLTTIITAAGTVLPPKQTFAAFTCS